MQREIKYKLVFQHLTSKEIIISSPIKLDDLINKYSDIFSLIEEFCSCNCEPVCETNVVECNCSDYYDEFLCIDKLQYTGLKDKNREDIYEGDVARLRHCTALYTCTWDSDSACFYWQSNVSNDYSNMHHVAEVIGNIYQNPELKPENVV